MIDKTADLSLKGDELKEWTARSRLFATYVVSA